MGNAEAQITLIKAILGLRKIHDPVEAVRILYEQGHEEFERVRILCGGVPRVDAAKARDGQEGENG